ncbi:BolA family protein [Stappia sp.]|uniref:BolA family protein n=1 Tax=Stappia sp. TaxID=1870903 RepID=UPI003D151024
MSIKQQIERQLTEMFSPASLEVIDESERHRGHGGWREGGETHFRVRIVAEALAGLGRVARHRAINDCLKPAFEAGVHALAIEARTPDEPDPRGGGRASID